jgi:hypothetical protein
MVGLVVYAVLRIARWVPGGEPREPSFRRDRGMGPERIVDRHVHVLAPQRFPYRPDTFGCPNYQAARAATTCLLIVFCARANFPAHRPGPVTRTDGADAHCSAAGSGCARGLGVPHVGCTRADFEVASLPRPE